MKASEYSVSGADVVARWSSCSKPNEGSGAPELQGTSWVDSKLVVVVKDNHYCGGAMIADPRFVSFGANVELRWTWKAQHEVTKCNCDHVVRFELSNLAKQDYTVQLVRER